MKSLSIIIVTWNCKKYLRECLDSLAAYRRDPEAEIIVVDNASEDGTPEMVRDSYPEVVLIASKENLGFPRGNNVGIKRSTGKYLCLINPDVVVHEKCIEQMLAYMEQNPAVGLLGPQMLGADGRVYRSYMGEPTLWNLFCRALALDDVFPKRKLFSGFLMLYYNWNQTSDVDILNGWFWMVRRSALDQVGLMDDTLFMYADDLDWSKRFRTAGWRVVYFTGAASIHYGGGTTARAPVRFAVEMQRANFQYWQKFHPKASNLPYLSIVCLHQLLRILGYSLLLMKPGSDRDETRFKIRRSVACLQWAVNLGEHGRRGAQLPVKAETTHV